MQSHLQFNNFRDASTRNEIDYNAIYTSCFPVIRNMVLKNAGTIDDARDIFQDSIIALFQKSGKDTFQLNVAICTYLYSIARNKWLQQIRNNGRTTGLHDDYDLKDDKISFDDDERMQKQRLFIKYLNNLGDKCQDILKQYFEGVPGEKIAKDLQFSSYEYYRLAKNRCTENLKKMIQKDPVFKELA